MEGKTPRSRTPPRKEDTPSQEVTGAVGPLQNLVEAFAELPGIGKKSAERLAYHILRTSVEGAMRLSDAIREVKLNVRNCRTCFNITEKEQCALCEDETRDATVICVVEQPKDLYAIEASRSYRGLYHVLLGTFAPLEGVSPSDLTISTLLARVEKGGVREVIIATNPDFEGDGTALFLGEKLKAIPGLRVTRIARGMPSGSHLEHVARTIVSDAMEGRREVGD